MADTTISGLPSIAATGNTIIPVSINNVTYQTSTSSVVDTIGLRNDYIKLPVGSTAQRPSSPSLGAIRYNTSLNCFEGWNGTNWSQFAQPFSAIGGTVTTATIGGVNYRIHTFITSNSFIATGQGAVEYFLVGGGGSGGRSRGGGGGGGGIATGAIILPAGTYSISIGSGGAVPGGNDLPGKNGENTTFNGIIALGGGGGGQILVDGKSGACGGGAGGSGGGVTTASYGGTGTQGYGGGNRIGAIAIGGGGGGAGGAGGTITSNVLSQGTGGIGVNSNFNGTSTYYAGGGGGGWNGGAIGAPGGQGGGGNGGGFAAYPATAGTNGLGGGGGGGGTNSATEYEAGAGGSGIAMIRYKI